MVERYSRFPSIIVLAVVVWAAGMFWFISRRANAAGQGRSVEQIERVIANEDEPKATTWTAYAQALAKARRLDQSAIAWKKVIDIEPSNREAKLSYAKALAAAGKADQYFEFVRDLVFGEAPVAKAVLALEESRVFASDPRFATMQTEARAQSMD